MKIKKEGRDWTWIYFKSERLLTFYFIYGTIRHADRFCQKLFDGFDVEVEKLFGAWLRAPGHKTQLPTSQRWLVSEKPRLRDLKEKGTQQNDKNKANIVHSTDQNQPMKVCHHNTECDSSMQTESTSLLFKMQVNLDKEGTKEMGHNLVIKPIIENGIVFTDQKTRIDVSFSADEFNENSSTSKNSNDQKNSPEARPVQ